MCLPGGTELVHLQGHSAHSWRANAGAGWDVEINDVTWLIIISSQLSLFFGVLQSVPHFQGQINSA